MKAIKKVKFCSLPVKDKKSKTLKSIPGDTKMQLPPLKVVGPISTLVTTIRVQGQSPGAEVLVFSLTDQQVKARGIATRCDQRFGLLLGAVLNNGDRLVATQRIGIDASDLPSEYLSIFVHQAPLSQPDIGHVKIESCFFCNGDNHIWVSECIPGAVVEAFFDGKSQGCTLSEEGIARLTFSDKPQRGAQVSVQQIVQGIGTGPISSITPEPIPGTFIGQIDKYQHGLLAN